MPTAPHPWKSGPRKSIPWKEPPPPPADGSPAYELRVKGEPPKPYRDFLKALQALRSPRIQVGASVIRVADQTVLAFRVREGETIKHAMDSHLHRPNRFQKSHPRA